MVPFKVKAKQQSGVCGVEPQRRLIERQSMIYKHDIDTQWYLPAQQ